MGILTQFPGDDKRAMGSFGWSRLAAPDRDSGELDIQLERESWSPLRQGLFSGGWGRVVISKFCRSTFHICEKSREKADFCQGKNQEKISSGRMRKRFPPV
jgi:hypothetical protein